MEQRVSENHFQETFLRNLMTSIPDVEESRVEKTNLRTPFSYNLDRELYASCFLPDPDTDFYSDFTLNKKPEKNDLSSNDFVLPYTTIENSRDVTVENSREVTFYLHRVRCDAMKVHKMRSSSTFPIILLTDYYKSLTNSEDLIEQLCFRATFWKEESDQIQVAREDWSKDILPEKMNIEVHLIQTESCEEILRWLHFLELNLTQLRILTTLKQLLVT